MFSILLSKEKTEMLVENELYLKNNITPSIMSQHVLISRTDCFEVIQKQLPAFFRLHQALFTQNNFYRSISDGQIYFHCPNGNG